MFYKQRGLEPKSLEINRNIVLENSKGIPLNDYYATNKKEFIYSTREVKYSLLSMFDNRCSICSVSIYDSTEVKQNNCYNILTIEHIITKESDPSKILEWGNLIPCCSRCNNSRGNKKYNKTLYINPTIDTNCETLFGFRYDGTIFSLSKYDEKRVNYMINLYSLNSENNRYNIKGNRRNYYELLINEFYQDMVRLNKKFNLSDNIIIFKDMYHFWEEYNK